MFADTSALVEILIEGRRAAVMTELLGMALNRMTSPLVRLEACMVLSTRVDIPPTQARRQFDQLLHFRDLGVPFDTYVVDAFWFARHGAYRTWRKPNWPNGPDNWLARCEREGIEPGLWFTANRHLAAPVVSGVIFYLASCLLARTWPLTP